MRLGVSFLKSKIARRFSLMFLLCAFLPTVTLVVLAYMRVVSQLQDQALIRLKRDAQAYGLSLFDRMIRVENALQAIGRTVAVENLNKVELYESYADELRPLFRGVLLLTEAREIIPVFDTIQGRAWEEKLTLEQQENNKPYVLTIPVVGDNNRIFIGVNVNRAPGKRFSVIGELKLGYFWGVGEEPLLPPMTELSVFDAEGTPIMVSFNGASGRLPEAKAKQVGRDLRVFSYEYKGADYFAASANIFIESRFQYTGWNIILSQARDDVMASIATFRSTFPFVVLLFLLTILYLSMSFIRKGLDPLEKLKAGTRRVAKKDFSTTVEVTGDDEFGELARAFNDMTGKLDKQFTTMSVLGEIDRAILSSFERKKILTTTLQRLKDFFQCDIASFVKSSRSTPNHIKLYILRGRRASDPQIEYHTVQQHEISLFFASGEYRIIEDGEVQSFFHNDRGVQCVQLLVLPIVVDGKSNRALLLGYGQHHQFNEDELTQARKIGNQLAIGLANSRLLEDLENLAMGTIEALARTVDAKSKWTSGHSERVAELARQIGQTMGLAPKELETIYRGGLLHDIGKIGIPLAILDKPGKLTDEEYAEIKTHPQIGGKILEPIDVYEDILPIVVQHHERYDGKGYPEGLKGDEIDPRARILSVADVWDALVSDRPYRGGWVEERARETIIQGSGSSFDPRVVDVFLGVLEAR